MVNAGDAIQYRSLQSYLSFMVQHGVKYCVVKSGATLILSMVLIAHKLSMNEGVENVLFVSIFCFPQSKLLYLLFEHAAGYALFSVKEFDEVATFLPQVESSVTDISKFQSIVKLTAFQAFRNGPNSLDNINAIAAGKI